MKRAVSVGFWTLFSVLGLSVGVAGNPVGWFVLVAGICFVVAAIRAEGDGKGDQSSDITLSITGDGGCGGCGGCGG